MARFEIWGTSGLRAENHTEQKITSMNKVTGRKSPGGGGGGGRSGRKSPGCFIHPCARLERVTWTSIIYIH